MSVGLKYDLTKFKIFNMERKDMDAMFKLWEDEGCEDSPWAADPYFNIDPHGYFKGVIGDEIVSTIMALRYSPNFAFIGYFINISVQAQVERYKKFGFSAYGIISGFSGKAVHSKVDLSIQEYDENAHLNDIVTYDQEFFPANRKEFLKNWLKKEGTKSFVFYDNNNKLRGYGSIYKNLTKYEISPCYCDSIKIAKAIIGSLANSVDENAELVISIHNEIKAPVDFIKQTRELCNNKKFIFYGCMKVRIIHQNQKQNIWQ